jgi:alkylation response protein AidB-like acyl-CoA dehydrogenase
MGMRVTDVNAAIYFDEVRVPVENRAGGPGVDWQLFRGNISWGRLTSAPMSLGCAQAVLEEVIEYTERAHTEESRCVTIRFREL